MAINPGMEIAMNSYKPLAANSKAYLRLIATMGVDQVYPFAEDMETDEWRAAGNRRLAMRPNRNRAGDDAEGGQRA